MTSASKRSLAACAGFGLVLLLSACLGSSPTTRSSSSLGGGNLNIRMTGDWDTLDPSGPTIPTGTGYGALMGAYDRLTENLPNGGAAPYLATSWKFTDSATIVFNLRTGVRCQDGTPLTATDVANSFTRLFKSPNAAPVFGSGIPTITADDGAHTVQFRWPHPNLDALFGFGGVSSGVICPAGLANTSKLATAPAGSGAYVLTSAQHGAGMTLTKNPAWSWGPSGLTAKDLPDTLTLSIVANDTTAANELMTGQLDMATIQGPDIARLQAARSLKDLVSTSFKLSPMTMNATPGHPTADPQVRHAIMTAVDPAAWNQAAYAGLGVTGTSIFSKSALCYEPATARAMPKPSVATAKQILTAAGYAPGPDGHLAKNGKTLSVTVIGSPAQWGGGTEYIAAQLTSVGINVTLADLDRASWVVRLRAGNYDVSVFPQSSPNIPSSQLQYIAGPLPPAGTNYSYYVDPAVDADLVAASNADQAHRCQEWSRLQLDILDHYDMLPLASPRTDLFMKPSLSVVSVLGLYDTPSLRRTA